MGVTIGEQQMWGHIGSIARDLNRIANLMEAAEKRAQAHHQVDLHLDDYPPEVQELITRLLIPGITVHPDQPPP
jgi:hypothetical protein